MIDPAVVARLEERQTRYCLIGAAALSARGYARYTADLDLLTLDPSVLQPSFWTGFVPGPELRHGDAQDPLQGLVRFPGELPLDIVVGKGYAARLAVHTAERLPTQACPVPTSLALVLNKLEAGGPGDLHDVVSLAQVHRQLGMDGWIDEVPAHLPRLSREARAAWARVAPDLRA